MEAILEPLIASPKLKLYVAELEAALRKEDVQRQRFREMCDGRRLEFINGEVIEQMATKEIHAAVVQLLVRLLSTFVQVRRAGLVRSEQALTEFPRNDYAPDLCFWPASVSSGFTGDTFCYPVPEFICEVLSPSKAARDRGVKFVDYAAHGVKEYWIIDPDAKIIEQYVLQGDRFSLQQKSGSGTIRATAIPGLVFPVVAAFDEQANLEALAECLRG